MVGQSQWGWDMAITSGDSCQSIWFLPTNCALLPSRWQARTAGHTFKKSSQSRFLQAHSDSGQITATGYIGDEYQTRSRGNANLKGTRLVYRVEEKQNMEEPWLIVRFKTFHWPEVLHLPSPHIWNIIHPCIYHGHIRSHFRNAKISINQSVFWTLRNLGHPFHWLVW